MASFKKAKKLIKEAKNIYILPSKDNQSESIPNSLALFYTLRKLNKNVNLIVEEIPSKFQFLIPSLNFLTYPKDFFILIPNSEAKISQIRYEKDKENLKIYLTSDEVRIKKNDVSFGFSNFNPDLLITVGVKDFNYCQESFLKNPKTLSGIPIINIDNQMGNKNFGFANLVKDNCSLGKIITNLIKSIDNNLWDKNVATCLLTGAIFSSQNLNFDPKRETAIALFDSPDFQSFHASDLNSLIGEAKTNFSEFQNLLVLWKTYASESQIRGLFYSQKPDLIRKILGNYQGSQKGNCVHFLVEDSNLNFVKDKVLKILTS